MPAISFKFRANGRTAQLVRHRYDKRIKRSRALPIGTLDRRADPDELPKGIKLQGEQLLTEEEMETIRRWLRVHGDVDAREERAARERRIEARVRAELESVTRAPADPFTEAVEALHRLEDHLPTLVAGAPGGTDEAGRALRPRYLEVLKAWTAVFEVAKAHGVAVTRAGRGQQSDA